MQLSASLPKTVSKQVLQRKRFGTSRKKQSSTRYVDVGEECMYLHIHMRTHRYAHIGAFLHLSLCVHVYICLHMSTQVYIYIYTYQCMYVYTCTCILCTHIPAYVCMLRRDLCTPAAAPMIGCEQLDATVQSNVACGTRLGEE